MKALAFLLIVLHGVDGRIIIINPAQITSMHAAKEGQANKLVTEYAQCVVSFTDGKFLSVTEDCDTIQHMIERR